MSYKIAFHGVEIVADTAAEAAALVRELAADRSMVGELPITPTYGSRNEYGQLLSERDEDGFNEDTVTLSFLRAIQRAPHTGVPSDHMMGILGVTHAKGIGSRMARINSVLEKRLVELRDPIAEVYQTTRTPNGRVWRAGPALMPAIELLTERVGRGGGVPR
jgi:hypothetical protein